MRSRMALLIFASGAALVAAAPAFAQSGSDGAAQKAPGQHQPGTAAAKPAPAAATDAPAKPTVPAQAAAPAEKLDPAKDAAIRHLMDITESSKMGENIQVYITQQVQDVAGRAIGQDKVQKFMETFTTKFNASSPPGAVTDAMVTIYAKNFSMEDIQGLIQFYETPLGKRVVKTLPEVSQQSQRVGLELDQNAAIAVLRGMTTEYPEIRPMLPPEEGKSGDNAPAPSSTPASSSSAAGAAKSPKAAPGTPATGKPAPQN